MISALAFTDGTSGTKKKKKKQQMQVQLRGQEDPMEEEVSTGSSSLPGKFYEQRSLVGVHFMGQQRVPQN